ncbi:hypothetical protein KUF71_006572 [Frankliniella fusca]|uniref:CCHC-type domain-containing protein n=1 Tax=Frankliniella fusca TaxID=407009 RepID=A0AAE1I2V6_9NEOP|nr:hypothetical protein KUF71_006572 [Frankliniella fusca]
MAAKGVTTDEQKRGILCQCLCDETKRKVREWIHPLTLTLCPYNRFLEVLQENITPSVNRDVQFNMLVTRFQQEGESGEAYVAELQRLADNLDFGWHSKLLVKYQLKRGIRDRVVQERLYADPAISLEGALETIVAVESSRACINSLQKPVDKQGPAQQPAGKPAVTQNPSSSSSSPIFCFRCGEPAHITKKCPKKYKECLCSFCSKVGHVAKACKKKQGKKKVDTNHLDIQRPSKSLHQFEDHHSRVSNVPSCDMQHTSPEIFSYGSLDPPFMDIRGGQSDLFCLGSDLDVDPLLITLSINGQEVQFQIDDGAGKTVMTESNFLKTFGSVPWKSGCVALNTWGAKRTIWQTHQAVVEVTFRVLYGKEFLENMYQVGRFAIHSVQCSAAASVSPESLRSWVHQFPSVSGTGTGLYKGPPAHFGVPPGTQPKYHYARSVPFALSARVEEAIDAKVAAGIWVPVEPTKVSCATALVPVSKKNGEVRLCAHYKSTINPVLQPDTYTSPTVNEILAMASGCEVFAELDAKEAYLQIPLSYETSMLMVVNTKRGETILTSKPMLHHYSLQLPVALVCDASMYRPGKSMGAADMLSRNPQEILFLEDFEPDCIFLLEGTDSDFPLTSKDIALATKEDPTLQQGGDSREAPCSGPAVNPQ